MQTANKNLVGVVVRNAAGKLTHIVSYGKAGYRLASDTKQVPMSSLVRKGRILVELDAERLKSIPKDQSQMIDGYLHIHSAAAYNKIKKGETVDIAPFDNWSRQKGKAVSVKKEIKPIGRKVKPAAKPASKSPDALTEPKALGTTSAKVSKSKAKAKAKPALKSDAVDRSKEAQQTLFIVMQQARVSRRAFKEFEEIVSKSLSVTPGDLPPSAREIVAKFGAAKVRKALTALAYHFNEKRAEQAIPRHLKNLHTSGTLVLSKTQVDAVIKALAPTVPESVLPHMIQRFFSGSVSVSFRSPEATKKPTAQRTKAENS